MKRLVKIYSQCCVSCLC